MNTEIIQETMNENQDFNLWFYIAIVEAIIIIILVLFILNNKLKMDDLSTRFKDKALSEDKVDFSNVINSAFNSQSLYDELRRKCHPDRFIDENLKREADEISQELGKYKNDLSKLEEIKERAQKILKI